MSTAPERAADPEPRFRDTLRGLPRPVWVVSLGILVNRLGNFLPVFIVLYLTERGYSAAAAGLVLGIAGVGNVLGNAVGGYLTDRIGRRPSILVSAVPTSALTALVPYVDPYPLVVGVVGLVGVTSQVYRPAAAAVLLDSVHTDQERLAAFALFRFALNIGAALGGVVGGVLASSSYAGLFLVNAVACLLFGAVVTVLLGGGTGTGRGGADAEPGREGSYREALLDRALVRFLAMTVVGEFVYIQHSVGLPLHMSDAGLGERDFGLLIGLNGLLVLTLELPVTAFVSRRRLEHVLAVGNLVLGLGLALTGVALGLGPLAVTVLVWTFGEMISTSVAQAYLGGLAPAHLVGRYQGLYGVAYTVGTGAGPLVGGAVYAAAPGALWVLVAVGGVLAAWLCLPPRPARGQE